jgi:hypothetical protein
MKAAVVVNLLWRALASKSVPLPASSFSVFSCDELCEVASLLSGAIY